MSLVSRGTGIEMFPLNPPRVDKNATQPRAPRRAVFPSIRREIGLLRIVISRIAGVSRVNGGSVVVVVVVMVTPRAIHGRDITAKIAGIKGR